jgi:ribosomal protein S18 acetylase RimI-like enzyme
MQSINLRELSHEDSFIEITAMLHRAFSRLTRMGIACPSASQSVAVTRQRILAGVCFVAECDGSIVGTVTLYRTERCSQSEVYRSRRVASLHQFAVDPEFQGRGVGRSLLKKAEEWASNHGYKEIALDTPHSADHLVNLYRHLGFNVAEILRFSPRSYFSCVLKKQLESRVLYPVASLDAKHHHHTFRAANDVLYAAPKMNIKYF